VLVTVEYIVQVDQRAAFVDAMRSQLRPIRSRDGAVFWSCSWIPRIRGGAWSVGSWNRGRSIFAT